MAFILNSVIGALSALLLAYCLKRIRLSFARSKFIRENGCQPPRKYPHKEPILGLDLFLAIVKSAK